MTPPPGTTALAVLVLALAVGCGGSSDIAEDDPTTTSTTTTTTTTTPPEPTTSNEPTTPSVSVTSPTDDGSRIVGAGYSVAIPDGWEDITKSLQAQNPQVDIAMGDLDSTGFRTNFNVVNTGSHPGTIEDNGPAIRKEAAAELKSITDTLVTPLDDRMIDGDAAIGQTSTFVTSGTSVTFRQYLVVHDGSAFPITMTFATSELAAATAQLEQILASWHWDT